MVTCSAASKTSPSIDLKTFANENNLKFLAGEGFFKTGDQGEAIVVLYTNADQKKAKMFVVQGASNFLNSSGNYQIAYSDSGMIVKNNEDYFSLSLDQRISFINKFEKEISSTKKIVGYGFGLTNLNGDIHHFKESLVTKSVEAAFYENFGYKI